jgi:8-oxo-dGTP pyrophosphatase MutT (NUDIX family)
MGKQDEKTGAGILFSCEDEVLLLLRNSKHNDNTWGLPGGNVEEGDASLFETAKRESTEELGPLPENFVPLWEVPVSL